MRIFVISAVLAVAGMARLSAAQEVHLKNGDVINADRVSETNNSVQYEIGDNSYTIPKSSVASVEAGERTGNATALQVPRFTPEERVGGEEHLIDQIVHEHEVDRSVLATIEARGDARETAIAYYIAARTEYEAGNFPAARRDFESAVRLDPQNPAILNYYSATLVRTGSALDAIGYAERASRLAPDSADAFAVLGYAQFAAGRLRDATESWRKSLALRPDASIQAMIARSERESLAETTYSERETGHFVLKYEGKQTSYSFRDQLLATLETDYRDLSGQFGSEPRSSIQVVLYTDQAFFDVTRAPSWMGALNDGKLRIPVQGVDAITPRLARVLRHELTHSFVNQLSMGRCPGWLNEGIAQALEPQTLGSRAAQLAEAYRLQRQIPLNTLNSSFASLSSSEVALAYDESLAAVEYIRSRYGMSDLLHVVQRIGEGESAEASLRQVLHTDYGHLEEDLRASLTGAAGN